MRVRRNDSAYEKARPPWIGFIQISSLGER